MGGVNPSWKGIKRGYFFSNKNKEEFYYGSSYELKAFKLLEDMTDVLKYSKCSTWIDYEFEGHRRYLPDILITYVDGTKQIVEVKPEYLCNVAKNKAKFEVGERFCKEHNMRYSVWTEKQLGI